MTPRGFPSGWRRPSPAPWVPRAVEFRGEAQDDRVPESTDRGRIGAQVPVVPACDNRGQAGVLRLQLDKRSRPPGVRGPGETGVKGRSPHGEADHDVGLAPNGGRESLYPLVGGLCTDFEHAKELLCRGRRGGLGWRSGRPGGRPGIRWPRRARPGGRRLRNGVTGGRPRRGGKRRRGRLASCTGMTAEVAAARDHEYRRNGLSDPPEKPIRHAPVPENLPSRHRTQLLDRDFTDNSQFLSSAPGQHEMPHICGLANWHDAALAARLAQ